LATKKKRTKQSEAEELLDFLVVLKARAAESWIDELREIETVAGIDSWEDVGDRLIELYVHIRAGAPLKRTETDGS